MILRVKGESEWKNKQADIKLFIWKSQRLIFHKGPSMYQAPFSQAVKNFLCCSLCHGLLLHAPFSDHSIDSYLGMGILKNLTILVGKGSIMDCFCTFKEVGIRKKMSMCQIREFQY